MSEHINAVVALLRPASLNIFPSKTVVMGVSSDGFTTMEFPAASAGAIFLVAIKSGWLLQSQ
jgi:hypothetical protein